MRGCVLLLLAMLHFGARSQDRCATMELPQNIHRQESIDQFEKWLQTKKTQKAARRALDKQDIKVTYEVPVVFHVVHDGSNIGTRSNVSEAKILEQLNILNEDFRRTNADAEETPSLFAPVAADTEIQFVMARQDPEGLPTNGIVRIKGTKDIYNPSDDKVLMTESYWPHDDYINIYITDLSGKNLGYAQFPFSNLEGIASELDNYKATDGVVLDYQWVGIQDHSEVFDSYGRTATHEMGHFLGLRHIWGDGGCAFDDFCDDTPEAQNSSSGCDLSKTTCGSRDMVQNYMDYTDDECMNLFTICQKERMRLVLEQSPRRNSLLTSPGLTEPAMVANDLGIRSIIAPIVADCDPQSTPSVQVRNYGTNQINTFTIDLYVNNSMIEQKQVSQPLLTGETAVITFAPITLSQIAESLVRFEISSVNGTLGGHPDNDTKSIRLAPFELEDTPYYEDFETNQNLFRITEQGTNSTWTFTTAPDDDVSNQAAIAPFFNQEVNFGQQDMLQTMSLDLSGLTSAELSFKYAYAPRIQENGTHYYLDGMIVAISTDCGQEFLRENYLFERYGPSLSTTGINPGSFRPSQESEWDILSFNLTRYAGLSDVKVAFIGINGRGNNLYIDDVQVKNAELIALDGGFRTIENAPVVTCEPIANPLLEIKNYGYENITSLSLILNANGTEKTFEYNELDLASGESEDILLNLSNYLQSGENTFFVSLMQVNGKQDTIYTNNFSLFNILVDSTADDLPIKQDFERSDWVSFSPGSVSLYDYLSVDGDRMAYTNNYDNSEPSKSYLVSPVLSTGSLDVAGLHFKYSYAQRQGFNDNLKVLLSTNCGKSFDIELLRLDADQMAVTTSSTAWTPSSEEHWRSVFIDLSDYMKFANIRLAFVFSNGNGNRLFIDDINILRTNDPAIPDLDALNQTMVVYPNPARSKFSVSFNYHEKNTINIKLVDMTGRVVFDQEYHNIINDKMTFQAPAQSGFYLLHIKGTNGINQTRRVYIKR